jgi:hypothetical protein
MHPYKSEGENLGCTGWVVLSCCGHCNCQSVSPSVRLSVWAMFRREEEWKNIAWTVTVLSLRNQRRSSPILEL